MWDEPKHEKCHVDPMKVNDEDQENFDKLCKDPIETGNLSP